METRIKITALLLMLFAGSWITPQKVCAQDASVSFQVFYNELSPYGTWVNNSQYGFVWVPDVAPGFIPYATNGYWVFTDEGWTWVSNYPWGWAPFHYGRWYTDPYYGPMWVPDNEWGPGWVSWRRSEGYYGWAPIGPGISISIAYGNGYSIPDNQWTFVRDRDFGRRNINNYYVDHSRNVTIIHNSTVISNTRENRVRNVSYNAGPERNDVEKHGGKPVVPVAIRESSKPGQSMNKNQLQIYRPQVQKPMTAGDKPAPARVSQMKDVKPPSQRTYGKPKPVETPQEVHHPLPPVKTGQPAKQQEPVRQQPASQPAKQQAAPQQHQQPASQPAKQQAAPQQQQHQQPASQPTKQQAAPQQRQQPAQQQHQQPAKQQAAPQQRQASPPQKQGEERPPHLPAGSF